MTPLSKLSIARPADPFVACLIPMYNEQDNIVSLLTRLTAEFETHGYRHRFYIVDDGSRDGSVEKVQSCLDQFPITLIQLSRNFGKETALTAGLDYVDGDVVVMIDADLQHPPEMVPVFLDYWRQGYDMVYGARRCRGVESPLKKLCTRAFYALVNWGSPMKMPENTQDFRVLDRCVVDALREMKERNRFMKGLYNWVGFNQKMVEIDVNERAAGETKFNFRSLLNLGLTGLTAFSNAPLRLSVYVGFGVAMASITYAVCMVLGKLFGVISTPPGWPTLVVAISFLGGVQLIAIGILGEYIGRIYEEVKQRPSYFTKKIDRSPHQTNVNTTEPTTNKCSNCSGS